MKKATPNTPSQKEPKPPKAPQSVWPTATSLKPGPEVIMAAAMGQPYAVEITRAWSCQHPIKRMSPEAYAALIERCGSVTF